MLESEMKKLTAAIEANTAALTGVDQAIVAADAALAATPEAPAAGAAAAPAVAPTIGAAAVVTPEAPAVAVDKKMLTSKFIELAQAKGREAAQQLLAEYNITSLPELKDKNQWPAFYAAIEAKLAA